MSDPTPVAPALEAANRFFAALSNMDWEAAANMVDVDAATSFREAQLASLLAWAQHRPAMMESRGRSESFGWSSDGKFHSDVAEQFVATPITGVAGVETLGELVAMSPLAFVATCLELDNSRSEIPGPEPRIPTRRHVLGGVLDGDAIVHVLYRLEGPDYEYTDAHHVEVLRFREGDHVWRVDLTTSNHDIANGFSFMMLADIGMLPPGTEIEPGAPDV